MGSKVATCGADGLGKDEDKHQSREAGFDLHLVKPVEQATLAKVLNEFEVRDESDREFEKASP